MQLAAVTATFFTPLGMAGFIIGGTLSGLASVRGTSMSGVYADGKLLTVRGMADASSNAYLLHFADAAEVAAAPYAGPPTAEQLHRMNEAIKEASSNSNNVPASSDSFSSSSSDVPLKSV